LADHLSALKRARQSERRRRRNLRHKTRVRTVVKEFRSALASGDKARIQQALLEAVSTVDRAARRGVLKANTASRTVSRLTAAATRAAA
jgi:small subunit ribosomal protein S20